MWIYIVQKWTVASLLRNSQNPLSLGFFLWASIYILKILSTNIWRDEIYIKSVLLTHSIELSQIVFGKQNLVWIQILLIMCIIITNILRNYYHGLFYGFQDSSSTTSGFWCLLRILLILVLFLKDSISYKWYGLTCTFGDILSTNLVHQIISNEAFEISAPSKLLS